MTTRFDKMKEREIDKGLRSGFGKEHFDARLRSLQRSKDIELVKLGRRIAKCHKRSRCNSEHCYECHQIRKNYVKNTDDEDSNGRKTLRSNSGRKFRNYMERLTIIGQMFDELEQERVSAVTINLGIHPLDEDWVSVVTDYRKGLRNFLNRHLSSIHAEGRFEFDDNEADKVPTYAIHSEAWRKDSQLKGIVSLCHIHLLVYHPDLSREELEDILRGRFPGRKQVNVIPLSHQIVDGTDLRGGAGWLFYGSKRHYKFSLKGNVEENFLTAAKRNKVLNRGRVKFKFQVGVFVAEMKNRYLENDAYENLEEKKIKSSLFNNKFNRMIKQSLICNRTSISEPDNSAFNNSLCTYDYIQAHSFHITYCITRKSADFLGKFVQKSTFAIQIVLRSSASAFQSYLARGPPSLEKIEDKGERIGLLLSLIINFWAKSSVR